MATDRGRLGTDVKSVIFMLIRQNIHKFRFYAEEGRFVKYWFLELLCLMERKKMSVSGIGSKNSYIYNMRTGKLSAKDGQADEFVDYFNGELDGEDSETLNGFDKERKGTIKKMFELMEMGMIGKNMLETIGNDEIEITSEKVDATTNVCYINGEKIFTYVGAVKYTADEIKVFGSIEQPYKTTHPTGYDPLRNRLSIGVGNVFEFGNGYRFTVERDTVRVDSYGKGTEQEYQDAQLFAFGLSALIHFGDQQTFASLHHKLVSGPMILQFLRELGVDTDKEFIINETRCEVVDGKIKEVGNKVGVPGSIHQEAMKRYEEMLYLPLARK